MKKIKEFIFGHIFKNDIFLHSAIEMKEKVDFIDNACDIEDFFFATENNRQAFCVIAAIYNSTNMKLNKIKEIGFPIYDYYSQDKYYNKPVEKANLSIGLNIGANEITLKSYRMSSPNNIWTKLILFKHSEFISVTFKKTEDGYKLLDYEGFIKSNKNSIVKQMKEIIEQLDKTKDFYSDCKSLLQNIGVEFFVNKYKDHKELITSLFICADENVKEKIFTAMQKFDLRIVLEDIHKVIDLLDCTQTYMPYSPEHIEETYEDKIRYDFKYKKNGFDHMLALIDKAELEAILSQKKSDIIVRRNKI